MYPVAPVRWEVAAVFGEQRSTACQWTQPDMCPTQPVACPSGTALNPQGWVPAPNHAAWACQHPGQSSRPVRSALCFALYSHLLLCGVGMFDAPKNTAHCTLFREFILQTCMWDTSVFRPPVHAADAHGHCHSICSVAPADNPPPGPGCVARTSGQAPRSLNPRPAPTLP